MPSTSIDSTHTSTLCVFSCWFTSNFWCKGISRDALVSLILLKHWTLAGLWTGHWRSDWLKWRQAFESIFEKVEEWSARVCVYVKMFDWVGTWGQKFDPAEEKSSDGGVIRERTLTSHPQVEQRDRFEVAPVNGCGVCPFTPPLLLPVTQCRAPTWTMNHCSPPPFSPFILPLDVSYVSVSLTGKSLRQDFLETKRHLAGVVLD